MINCEIVLASDNPEEFCALTKACDRAGLNLDMVRAVLVREGAMEMPRDLAEAREIARAKTLGLLKRDNRMIVSMCTCLIEEKDEPSYFLVLIYMVLPQGRDDFAISDPIPFNSHWFNKRLILAETITQAFNRI